VGAPSSAGAAGLASLTIAQGYHAPIEGLMPASLEDLLRHGVLAVYFGSLSVLTAYGLHRWILVALYLRHRRDVGAPRGRFDVLPRLTVQLPLYNEVYVAERLIEAVGALDYPRDRLEIQVLDDSTDETTAVVERAVGRLRAAGLDAVHLRREDRTGFKAGALARGLAVARGDLVAIFDADFVPRPDFARNLVHHFTNPKVGMVQARWGHLNAEHSALTRVQSVLLDGHFVIEHTARHRSGRFFNFNGTAGIWRRECILDAGGWQHDTLTEDLDLSYRAQLRGWKFVFLPDEVAPAELPVEMGAFKSQQHRWAKGSIQTARKLLPRILRSRLPLGVKLEAAVHLTANVGYVMMVLLALSVVPSVWLRGSHAPWIIAAVDLPLFTLSTLSVLAFYVVARLEASKRREPILRWVPFLMAVGIGLSINNARAVIEALAGRASAFRRTPKYNLATGDRLAARRYRGTINGDTWIELALAVYFAAGTAAAAAAGLWAAVPFLLLFEAGYAYTSVSTIVQALQREGRRVPAGA
jgi:cellulose synthase/poly-beta-1,6-N-acetylglucosamine synthase-like glycosyltransferase